MKKPDSSRVKRLKHIATILYGTGDGDGEPRAGWRSALAREMGMVPTTITDTVNSPAQVSVFDSKLAKHIDEVIVPRLLRNAEELRLIAADIMKKKSK